MNQPSAIDNNLQIGSPLNTPRYSSMNKIIVWRGGRAPLRQNKQTFCVISHWPDEAGGSLAQEPSSSRRHRSVGLLVYQCRPQSSWPNHARWLANNQSWQRLMKRQPIQKVLCFVIHYNTKGPLTDFRWNLVCCLAHSDPNLSEVGAIRKPGTVQDRIND